MALFKETLLFPMQNKAPALFSPSSRQHTIHLCTVRLLWLENNLVILKENLFSLTDTC